MADCSYSRCIQQRRNIKRELQRWTKNMVYIVGLERIAEELMGRRKWKLYQDSMQQRNYLQPLNNNVKQNDNKFATANNNNNNNTSSPTTTATTEEAAANKLDFSQHGQLPHEGDGGAEEDDCKVPVQRAVHNNNNNVDGSGAGSDADDPLTEAVARKRTRLADGDDDDVERRTPPTKTTRVDVGEEEEEEANSRLQPSDHHNNSDSLYDLEKVKDWSPTSKCIFCVDGKLDEHNNHGGLSPRQSESESSDAASDTEAPITLTPASAAAAAASLLNNRHQMTALETSMMAMAAALSAGGGGGGVPPAGGGGSGGGGGGGPNAGAHLPAYYPPLGPNWILTNMARNLHAAAASADGRPHPLAAAAAAAAGLAANLEEKAVGGGGGGGSGGGEQPLDLSSKGGSGNSTPNDNRLSSMSMRLPTLDNKHIFNSDFRAKPRMSAVGGRRTYTEEELQAALRDIQSGKLGTRRAAVIYGIPRSTLRNKIDEEEGMDDEKELSGAEEEKEVEKALEAPLLSYDDLVNSDSLKAFLAKTLGATGDGGGGPGVGGRGGDGCGGQEAAYTGIEHSAFGAHIQKLLLRSLMSSQKLPDGGSGGDSVPTEMVMKRLMAQELLNEHLKLQQHHHQQQQNNGDAEKMISRPSPSNSVICRTEKSKSESDMETEDSGSNVILKIPSFKPTSATSKNGDYRGSLDSASMVSPSVTSDSTSPPILSTRGLLQKDVKDLIAKSITQRFQQSPEPALRNPPIIDFDMKRGRFTPPLGASISVIKAQEARAYPPPHHHQPHQQHHHPSPQPQKSQQPNSNSSGGGGGGKGTRPKRGKYRNYDRDSLVEAVRAVQRGEMSVHRAGSYYGVPHSTLEYKVKERHLMRPRKRDPKPNPVDEKIASLKQNDLRNAAAAAAAAAASDKLKSQVIKPTQKFAPSSPNGIKLPMYDPTLGPLGYGAPPFPFWPPHAGYPIPLDYGRTSATAAAFPASPEQFFASQMIQKLHEDSRTHLNAQSAANLSKSTRQMAESLLDPAETNGLLDGIIRSSLESGVPGDDRKEDRNVAPENMSNKALLDQLCRNSRLAPMKLATDGDDVRKERKDSTADSDASMERDEDVKPDIHTIELSNDSNDSKTTPTTNNTAEENGRPDGVRTPRPGLIYLKQELTKPENLKPEMLVRFRDALQPAAAHLDAGERNGIAEGSASESDAAQD